MVGRGARDRRIRGGFREGEGLGGRVLKIGSRGAGAGDEADKFRVEEGNVGEEVKESVRRGSGGRGDEVVVVGDWASGYRGRSLEVEAEDVLRRG